jgi:hypothetical protein
MKELKYIKLFEAFDSEKFSKTLAYITDKNEFLSKIKNICNIYDYPYSQLNDDLFDYLPFNKALKKADVIDDEPCDATSIGEFDDSGLDGEKCESGKIKRKWGERERVVSCPKCNGTGIKVKRPGDIKMVKFWFTKDGELVGTTAVDGINRNISEKMSNDINDYTIGDTIAKRKLKSLPTGTFVKLDYNGWYGRNSDIICYIINENRTVYGIQNKVNGSSPWRYSNWNKINDYSIELTQDSVNNIKMLIPNNVNSDPYNINVGVDVSRYSSLEINTRIDVKELIKGAHFALILDLTKLKKSGYKSVSKIKSERSDLKSGAISLLSDEEIRNTNIKRYLDKISKDINITDDIKNISKFVKRLLGFRSALYLLLVDSNVKESLSNVIGYYYHLLSNPSEESVSNVNYYTKRALERSGNNLTYINNNLRDIRNELSDKNYSKEAELLKSLDEISLLIYDRISSLELETIEDLEVVHQKLLSIRNIFTTSRYKISNISSFLDYLDQSNYKRPFNQLVDHYRVQDNIDSMLSEVDRVKKIIEKI